MTTATVSLSTRQVKILQFIAQAVDTTKGGRGFPPTVREIGRAVGISSTAVVGYNLERLEALTAELRGQLLCTYPSLEPPA